MGFRAPINEDIGEVRSSSNHQLERLIPESTYLLLDLFNGLAGYKFVSIVCNSMFFYDLDCLVMFLLSLMVLLVLGLIFTC